MARKDDIEAAGLAGDSGQDPSAGLPQAEGAAPELRRAEQWGAELKTPAWKLAGALRAHGWTADKAVSRAEYDQAVAAFERRPLGGR